LKIKDQETTMPKWNAFPHLGDYRFDAGSVTRDWGRLHAGDAEPLPQDPLVLEAWVLLHNGEFQQAREAGLKAGWDGVTVANKATCAYANYLEKKEKNKLDLFMEVAQRAEAQATEQAKNPNAWYWHAYALGRYSQGISVAKALAQGLGGKVKEALENTIKLQPRHADAHIALGAFHAEVIDKVGSLIGGMTYGAKKEVGLRLFQDALKLNPASPIGMIEYANGLVMLEGDRKMKEATKLYEQAAASKPLDATERLDVELAKAELDQ
jgi:tetratricopeptide (TPR) repeat protein